METSREEIGRDEIDAGLVHRLVAAQFPQWAHLAVMLIEPGGWDNRTFRLGADLSVRLPSAAPYASQVTKEHLWLPRLVPHLPLPIPESVALGVPTPEYPWPWSVRRWLTGEPASAARITDIARFGADLAGFLIALQRIDPTGGPAPGAHNFLRGALPAVYDAETRRAIASLAPQIDAEAATAVWEAALEATWTGPPVWLHGDVAAGNLLVQDGRLAAVLDFGCCAVGDPACDLTPVWTLLSGTGRAAFQEALPNADPGLWARARGWALWKALITVTDSWSDDPARTEAARQVIAEVLTEQEGFPTFQNRIWVPGVST